MVARYIPSIIVIFVALAAYRLLGIGELFEELIKPKHLQPSYDYIIGKILSIPVYLRQNVGKSLGLYRIWIYSEQEML